MNEKSIDLFHFYNEVFAVEMNIFMIFTHLGEIFSLCFYPVWECVASPKSNNYKFTRNSWQGIERPVRFGREPLLKSFSTQKNIKL